MGSPFTIILYDGDSLHAARIAGNCFSLVDSLVLIFSDYIDSSELNRLCERAGRMNAPVTISAPLYYLLTQSKMGWEKSNGTFDITIGPLARLWRKARKDKIFPDDKLIKEKMALTGFEKLQLFPATQSARLLQPGMQLDLGGIAQGYIAQQVIDYLKVNNIRQALVNASGDIVALGAPPHTKGWTIGVNIPGSTDEILKRFLIISDKAVTTSGDVYQYMYHNGKRYSHIIHPKTGYGISSQRNVTVIADNGTKADWLTKACTLLPVKKAKKLAMELNAALLITEIKKGKIVYHSTPGFAQYWK